MGAAKPPRLPFLDEDAVGAAKPPDLDSGLLLDLENLCWLLSEDFDLALVSGFFGVFDEVSVTVLEDFDEPMLFSLSKTDFLRSFLGSTSSAGSVSALSSVVGISRVAGVAGVSITVVSQEGSISGIADSKLIGSVVVRLDPKILLVPFSAARALKYSAAPE